mmetsp:Transcript_482/g.1725  ORF Transcript_482/g.1725 Transcript_482/m.1725 type:complete len:305 (+) Transcript_482:908-1822(+)
MRPRPRLLLDDRRAAVRRTVRAHGAPAVESPRPAVPRPLLSLAGGTGRPRALRAERPATHGPGHEGSHDGPLLGRHVAQHAGQGPRGTAPSHLGVPRRPSPIPRRPRLPPRTRRARPQALRARRLGKGWQADPRPVQASPRPEGLVVQVLEHILVLLNGGPGSGAAPRSPRGGDPLRSPLQGRPHRRLLLLPRRLRPPRRRPRRRTGRRPPPRLHSPRRRQRRRRRPIARRRPLPQKTTRRRTIRRGVPRRRRLRQGRLLRPRRRQAPQLRGLRHLRQHQSKRLPQHRLSPGHLRRRWGRFEAA